MDNEIIDALQGVIDQLREIDKSLVTHNSTLAEIGGSLDALASSWAHDRRGETFDGSLGDRLVAAADRLAADATTVREIITGERADMDATVASLSDEERA